MSYTLIQEKIDQGKIILLDGGIGAELEKKGAKMDKNLWCGKCSVDSPEFLKEVHENYIDGADVQWRIWASTRRQARRYRWRADSLYAYVARTNHLSGLVPSPGVRSWALCISNLFRVYLLRGDVDDTRLCQNHGIRRICRPGYGHNRIFRLAGHGAWRISWRRIF